MKKVYCDRCGKEMEQNDNLILREKTDENNPFKANIREEYFDICPKCRDSFFDWLNNKPAEQEKPVKVAEAKLAKQEAKKADKPVKKSAKEGKSSAYTVQQLAELSSAPASTVRRHAEGICSTYSKDKQGRTIRRYHLTDDQLTALIERIKGRKQGQRTKI